MARPVKIPWDEIEADYVSGSLSYKQIAAKYEVSGAYLARQAGVRNWVKKRQQFRRELTSQIVETKLEQAILDKTEFDIKGQQGCDLAVAKALRVLAASDENRDEVAKALLVLSPELDKFAFTKSPVEVALGIIERALNIKYRILDIPAPLQRHDIKDDRKAPADITMEKITADLKQFIQPDQLTFVIPADKVKGNGGDNGGQA